MCNPSPSKHSQMEPSKKRSSIEIVNFRRRSTTSSFQWSSEWTLRRGWRLTAQRPWAPLCLFMETLDRGHYRNIIERLICLVCLPSLRRGCLRHRPQKVVLTYTLTQLNTVHESGHWGGGRGSEAIFPRCSVPWRRTALLCIKKNQQIRTITSINTPLRTIKQNLCL